MEDTYIYEEGEMDPDEEALFSAEELEQDDPEEAMRVYASIADSAEPNVRLEALQGLVRLHSRMQQPDAMHSCFSRMLELRSKVYPNALSAAVSKVLDAIEDVDLAISMHTLAASALAPTKSKSLWFNCSIRLCKLFLEEKRFDDVHLLLEPLKHSCLDAAGEEDLSNKGVFLLEIIYIEALLCAESSCTSEEVRELHRRMTRVVKTLAVPDQLITGFVNELFGVQLLRSGEWDRAFDALHQANNSYEEVGSNRRRVCLKLLLRVCVVLFQTLHLFDKDRSPDLAAPMLAEMRLALESGAPSPNDELMNSLVAHALGKPYLVTQLFATRKREMQRLAYDHYWTILHHVMPDWLDVRSLMALDAATLNRACREYLGEFISGWLHNTPMISRPSFAANSVELAWLAKHRCPLSHLLLVQPFTDLTKTGVFFAEESLRSLRSFTCHMRVMREQTLLQLVSICQGITHLDMSNCTMAITDSALAAIGSNCHQLNALILFGCSDFSVIGMNAIADGCPELHVLNVGRSCVDDMSIARVLLRCDVQELQLLDTTVSDASLLLLAHSCPHLVKLFMLGCKCITDEGLNRVADTHPYLTEVSLAPRHSDACLKQLVKRCPNLTFLRLSPIISDAGIRSVASALPNLTGLDASACLASSEEQFARLAERCTQLVTLKLPATISDIVVIRFVECCPSLKVLHIGSSLPFVASRSVEYVTDVAIARIAEMCPLLESLELSGCGQITVPSISALIDQCPRLHRMSLFGCVQLASLGPSDGGMGCPREPELMIDSGLSDLTIHRLHMNGRSFYSYLVGRRMSTTMRFEVEWMRTDDEALSFLDG